MLLGSDKLASMATLTKLFLFAALFYGSSGLFGCATSTCAVPSNRAVTPDFVIKIAHHGRALAGVTIDISIRSFQPDGEEISATHKLSTLTGENGVALVHGLPPGEYFLSADYLGTGAAWDCFHVADVPSAASSLAYEWGNDATEVREATGTLSAIVPGEGKNPVDRILHEKRVGASTIPLTFTDAFSKQTYHGVTGSDGKFLFASVPEGMYVLTIGNDASDFPERTLIVEIKSTAARRELSLVADESDCGPSLLVESEDIPAHTR